MSKDEVINNSSEIFTEFGNFSGDPYNTELRSEVKSVINHSKLSSLSLNKKLNETLDNLDSKGVIKEANKLRNFVNGLVIDEIPGGSLRICLDHRNLNKAIKREHHIIPTAEELINRLDGKRVFSVFKLLMKILQDLLFKDTK